MHVLIFKFIMQVQPMYTGTSTNTVDVDPSVNEEIPRYAL